MKMATFVLVVPALLLGLPTSSGHGGQAKKDDKVPSLMKQKLTAAQKVLEGIAMNDFEKIGKEAGELIDISKRAEWKILSTPQYELFSNDFRRIADSLTKSAREKTIDGAALNYVDLTLACVKCHKYVRETRNTSFD